MRQTPADEVVESADPADDLLAPLLADYHAALLAGVADQPASSLADSSPAALDANSQAELARAERVLRSLVRARKLAANGSASQVNGSSQASGLAPSGQDLPLWVLLADKRSDGPPLKQLGRFEIVRELGRGGLGVVFLAHDPVLRRQVAIKVPRPEVLLNSEASARFDREAQAVARLAHPNLVPVFEIGQAGVIKYIAAAYCSGPNLANWLRELAVLPAPRAAAALVAQLADAVHYAHTQGVMHRDIKPSNVLLEPIGDELDLTLEKSREQSLRFTPKLVDFGLAKLEGSQQGETRTGIMLGTPGYMAPEQIEGHLAEIGPRTDVYGLGTVLYELLTGRCPFSTTSVAQSTRLVLSEEPPRPRQLNRSVPADLEAICLKCLEKSPSRRYASAAELAADLRRFVAHEPTRARPAGTIRRMAKWSRRKPWAAALALVVALFLVILGSVGALYTANLRESLARESRLKDDLAQTAADLRTAIYPLELERLQKMWERGDAGRVQRDLSKLREARPSAASDFAFAYLDRVTNRPPFQVLEHPGEIYGLAYSPDGTLLASCGQNKQIRLWNAADGQLLRTIDGHAAEVNSVAFAPDGQSLYAVDDAGRIVRWRVADGTIIDERAGAGGLLWCASLSPDGRRLAVVGSDPKTDRTPAHAHLAVHATDGGYRILLERIDERFRAAEYGADGRLWVTGGSHETLWEFDYAGTIGPVLDLTVDYGWTLTASGNGELVAVASRDGHIHVVDALSRAQICQWHGHLINIESLQFAPDETYLVSAARDGRVRFWDPRTGALLDSLDTSADRLWTVRISPDGNRIAAAGSSRRILVWLRSDFPWKRFVKRYDSAPWFTGLACPERMLVTHSLRSPEIELIDANTGEATAPFPVHFPGTGPGSKFSPGGELLGLVYGHRTQKSVQLRRIDAPGSSAWREFAIEIDPGIPSWYDRLVFSPDGQRAYLLSHEEKVLVVDCETLAVEGELSGLTYRDATSILCPTNTVLIVANTKPEALVVDLRTNHVLRTLALPKTVGELRCSQSGKLLAIDGRSADIWNFATGEHERTLECDTRIVAAEFSPTGGEVALIHEPTTIALFDLDTGGQTLHLPAPAGALNLGFSPDGTTLLVAGCGDSQLDVRVWTTKSAGAR